MTYHDYGTNKFLLSTEIGGERLYRVRTATLLSWGRRVDAMERRLRELEESGAALFRHDDIRIGVDPEWFELLEEFRMVLFKERPG